MTFKPTTTLCRPTSPKELEFVRASGRRAWGPPRLPEQPIFYPVLNEEYAIKIARNWNAAHDGADYASLARNPVQQPGGRTIQEPWAPAEDPAELNTRITDPIDLVQEFS
ncbi:hypothetical protein [Actinomadura rupiterrae]|uniref:hypothetical protein n=1 Tax=Actinomadura rupiterrae TaxID=559627 RepID=UPI0020A417E6|nr:hypothetical protein [Actinomadura rupiterrae]MCP2341878.1 hypothetical protein [Actinomadura rupiterrae]